MERSQVLNFGAGPSALPETVLEQATKGLLNYEGTGIGITELSHRSKEFKALNEDLSATLRGFLHLPETHEILFLQGGASLQFSTIVLNLLARYRLLHPNTPWDQVYIDYIITGTWSKKAYEEAKRLTEGMGINVRIAADGRIGGKFESVPSAEGYDFSPKAQTAFVYYCENETVNGVQFSHSPPLTTSFPLSQFDEINPPLIADFSSSFLSRPIPNIGQYGLIYGGAQKNVGPAGLTILLVRKDLLVDVDAATRLGAPVVPLTLGWKLQADNASLYNTPPMWSMYVSLLVLKELVKNGGLGAKEEENYAKQEVVYKALDKLEQKRILKLNVRPGSRSWMNVTFVFNDPEAEKRFLEGAEERGFKGVKGHRSVGGIRISLYNAITLENAKTVAKFLEEFGEAEGKTREAV